MKNTCPTCGFKLNNLYVLSECPVCGHKFRKIQNMKKRPDQSELVWIFVVTVLVTISAVAMMWITPPQKSKPVYYKPAGAPDSIPCSSSTNSRCMEYYPL